MKSTFTTFIIICWVSFKSVSQPNCDIYKWNGDENCYKACIEATEANNYPQGSAQSQYQFDKAIELCPNFDYAYFEKAVPYLKRGDFITWKLLIDKAVELNPHQRLGYRGWCRYQFLGDFEGAIEDIEKLESLVNYDIGYCQNGDYHLIIAKALCYKGLGIKNKAINLIEDQLKKGDYSPLPYDYLHLGVLKLESGDFQGAIEALQKQNDINNYLAETYYYLALAYKAQPSFEDYQSNLNKAKDLYLKGYRRSDPYTEPMDKIYLTDIENEINNGW
jgi:tetratricopeptide (TPR) repeat protein